MNRRRLIGAIFGALLLAGLIFGMATYAAERHSNQVSQAVASKASTANAATLATSNKGDKQNQAYTDTQVEGLSSSLAASVETSEVISPDIWSTGALALTDSTGTTYLFSVNSPDSPGAAMFRVPVSINGKLTVSEITSGNIDMPSGMLTVNSVVGSGFLLGNDGSASFSSVKTSSNAAVGKDLSVESQAAVNGDLYAGANGNGTYGLQYNYAPGDTVRSLTLDGPISASELRIGTASKLDSDSFVTDYITANKALTSNGTLTVSGASTLADVTAGNIIGSGALQIAGASTLAETSTTDLSASGTLTVTGDSNLATVYAGDTTVDSLTDKGALIVKGDSDLQDAKVNKGLTVVGATDLQNGLSVEGTSTLSGALNVNGSLDIGAGKAAISATGDAAVHSLKVADGASIDGTLTAGALTASELNAGSLKVADGASVAGTLTADSLSVGTLSADSLNMNNNDISDVGAITMNGELKVNNDATVVGSITGGALIVGTTPYGYGIAADGAITGSSLGLAGAITGATDINASGQVQVGLLRVGATSYGIAADGTITGSLLELSGGEIKDAGAIGADTLNVTTQLTVTGNITIDANGNLTATTVKADSLTLTNGAGQAIISKDATSVALPSHMQGSIVIATPTSDPGSYWWIEGGYIYLAEPPSKDVTFNCIAVN